MEENLKQTPINVSGAAHVIGRTEAATRRLIARKQLPFSRLSNGRIVLFEEELVRWLELRSASQGVVSLEEALTK